MKRLLLLIPVAAAFYALWLACNPGGTAMGLLVLAPVLLGFVIQALVLRIIRWGRASKWLCYTPLVLLGIPLGGAVIECARHSFFWELGAVLWLVIALLYALGWVSAFGLEKK